MPNNGATKSPYYEDLGVTVADSPPNTAYGYLEGFEVRNDNIDNYVYSNTTHMNGETFGFIIDYQARDHWIGFSNNAHWDMIYKSVGDYYVEGAYIGDLPTPGIDAKSIMITHVSSDGSRQDIQALIDPGKLIQVTGTGALDNVSVYHEWLLG